MSTDPRTWRNETLLAPLTRGGTLPFRRLCVELGARITCGEMAYAREVNRGSPKEWALLQHHDSESCFGVQLAGSSAARLIQATQTAAEQGATYVDLNCGCPIHDTTRRGLGARLLQKPPKLARLLQMFVDGSPLPVTIKIRLGWETDQPTAREIARIAEEAGVSALTLHGRSRNQRYSKPADYAVIREIAAERSIPVIGNGDVLTWYEAEARREGLSNLMVARGALIKPWIFREIAEGRELCLTATERLELYLRLARYYREHLGDGERGQRRAWYFLPWHFKFFHRYRPLPAADWAERAAEYPLMQTRMPSDVPDDPLEALLQSKDEAVHEALAQILWTHSAGTLSDALPALQALAEAPPASGHPATEPSPAG